MTIGQMMFRISILLFLLNFKLKISFLRNHNVATFIVIASEEFDFRIESLCPIRWKSIMKNRVIELIHHEKGITKSILLCTICLKNETIYVSKFSIIQRRNSDSLMDLFVDPIQPKRWDILGI